MEGCIYRTKDGECDLYSEGGKYHAFCDMDVCEGRRLSHGDKIRAMTDEELAEMHVGVGCPPGTDLNELCFGENGEELLCTPPRCRECWFKWLRQEAKA